jgi:hypothetical protein
MHERSDVPAKIHSVMMAIRDMSNGTEAFLLWRYNEPMHVWRHFLHYRIYRYARDHMDDWCAP